MIKSLLVLCVISLASLCSFAQGEHDGNRLYDHDLDENKWEDIRNDIRYEGAEGGAGKQWTYENDKEYKDAKKKQGGGGNGGSGAGDSGDGASSKPSQDSQPRSSSRSSSSSGGAGGLGFLGYILLGVFFVGLLVLIYFLFLNAPKKGKKVGEHIALEDLNPTEIPLTELQRLLQEALAKGDYRGAIRIYFIFIIRDLAEKQWIDWEKEKTNFHYLREMAGKAQYDDFNRTVSYFEIIWYGKREIDESKFNEIKPNFTEFLTKLGVK